ncbi:MAG: sulfurtransferase TusA family protein [Candidatus Thermoplasmatota archaeon]|nr:sulfurtransferase TusA family protein [Candidatus Thermoplasmatota archaeon]MCJ2556025.1 sulfurtransferase TusA family protein [Candidatus Thermoplasmatota archaeon]MCJ2669603.1 sulfurtransferase TusA family protein [Candidatus Thermoplasmatota archaeon]
MDRTVDARDTFCPGPLMELIRAVKEGEVGEVIAVWSKDAGSQRDIPLWIEKAGHELLAVNEKEEYNEFVIKKLR